MGATEPGQIDMEPWMTESSALSGLVVGVSGTLSRGARVGESGLAGGAATVVAVAIVVGTGALAIGLLGRLVNLPFPRQWALTAAVLLGFGAVVANGLLAARSVWLTDGADELLAVTALIAVSVLAVLGGLVTLAWVLDPGKS
jgi:hypothetical protein